MARDFVTASELNQLASSWGSHRFHSCYYRKCYLKLQVQTKGKKEAIFLKRTMKINPPHFFRAWILLMIEWN